MATPQDEIAKLVVANFILFVDTMMVLSLNLIDICITLICYLFQKPDRTSILDHALADQRTRVPNHHAPTRVPSPSEECSGGLNPSMLNRFPTVEHTNGSEEYCSICCEKFVRREKLKLLPACCHTFHRSCIIGWFKNKNTCPLCRCDYSVI